jgi:hypothetical protein
LLSVVANAAMKASLKVWIASVDTMVVGLHQLQLVILFGKKSLDVFCSLIINDI